MAAKPSHETLSVEQLRAIAQEATAGAPEGPPLEPMAASLIAFGVAVSVTAVDRNVIEKALDRALAAGATIAQAQEVVALVSGLGVHSLMVTSTSILARAQARGEPGASGPLDAERQALWQRHVGDDPFWTGFEKELPGFLDALLRLSPDGFVAFFDYCAVPWKSGTVRAKIKELIAMACDAAPTHRFMPGFRVHLNNALALGVGRAAILQALDIAAAAPEHSGTR